MANALASGRSIVSKTDWKEEDAQYLVQLIERQFPKGNIIWEWVGQHMASRGFSKSQCRSKWKRIRTKVLHGNDPPNKDKDARDHPREQEADELIEEDDDDLGDHRPLMADSRQDQGKWHHRQDYDRPSEGAGYSDSYRSGSYGSRDAYDRHRSDAYYQERDFRDGYRPRSPGPLQSSGHRSSIPHHSSRQTTQRSMGAEEDELWSEEESNGRYDHNMGGKRLSQDYQSRDHLQHRSTATSHHHHHHHRRQPSSAQVRDETGDDSSRSLSAIAATPTSFGKIEWKPEDSDYLVHLIETKFASRKVDWAWVSKQMEGRGYDRTQCKSRWWRVQHRQNQANQQQPNSNQQGSVGRSPSRHKQRESFDHAATELDPPLIANGSDDKATVSDDEAIQGSDQRSPRQRSASEQEAMDSVPRLQSSSSDVHTQGVQSDEPDVGHHRKSKDRLEDEEAHGAVEGRGTSPRPTRTHEHQKHIEWKEEDSQYMYRLIEKEFPVGNIIWSVIAEKMQSRGYSQTQCMSKWRRYLKNSKLASESNKGGVSMDLDVDSEMSLGESRQSGGFRRRGQDDRSTYSDVYGDGAKRFRRDDSRRHDRGPELGAAESTNARMVEMEYDRYYDSVGKRKRLETERAELETGYQYHHGRYSPSYGDYRDDGRESSRYPQEADSASTTVPRNNHVGDVKTSPTLAAQETEMMGRSTYRDGLPREHADSVEADQKPRHSRRDSGDGSFEREEDTTGPQEEHEEQTKSTREPHSSGRYHNQPSSTSTSEPQRWSNERRSGHHADQSQGYSAHHDQPDSPSASSPYHDYYDANHGYSGEHGAGDHVHQRHSRASEPTLDQNDVLHRPPEPERRSRPIGRSPERTTVGNSSSRNESRGAGSLTHHEDHRGHDYHPPVETSGRKYHSRLSHDYDYDYDHDYDYEYDHHRGRRGGRGPLYPQRSRQDYDRDSEYVDYALEDDMDWAAGRWESRDMARLAAAVARQGRRWETIRAQIRIPVIVSPYDDMDDIYEGIRFDPHPSLHRNSYDEPRRARHHVSSGNSRPSSSSQPGSQSYTHRRYPSSASKYGPSSSKSAPGLSSSSSERKTERQSRYGEQVAAPSTSETNDPLQVDLTMEDAEEEVHKAESSGYTSSHRYEREQGREDDVVDVVSIGDAEDNGAESETRHRRGNAAMEDQDGERLSGQGQDGLRQEKGEKKEETAAVVGANQVTEEMDMEEMKDSKDRNGTEEQTESLNVQRAQETVDSNDPGSEADRDLSMAMTLG
ncbi:hypothetical protein BGZ65_003240 [Modicella reniformis]|uniref:Myb-like domain-containing protein n=1 Tax=Modicella reniformis TaxID=1440133 RepID=A0A9P6IZX2_9FUNG|nr:hypothetical protein BGZ65_003240 [Modicella reniformis]